MSMKTIAFWLARSLIGLYTAFVLQHLWNWFVTVAFGIPAVPFLVMYGILILLDLLADNLSNELTQHLQFKALSVAVEACIPEDKRASVRESMEVQTAGVWVELGLQMFGRVVGSTFALVLGAIVHLFV
jgi:hypothetical protein